MTPIRNKELLKEVMEKINSLPTVEGLREQFGPLLKYDASDDEVLRMAAAADITEVWDQAQWFSAFTAFSTFDSTRTPGCGTAGCFAGWTAILSGAEPASYSDVYPPDRSIHIPVLIREYAQSAIGLLPWEADVLFLGTNSKEMLNKYVDNLLNDRDILA